MLNSDDEEIFYSSVAIEYIVPQGKEAVFLKMAILFEQLSQ
ncbi:MAG: hypothetical protein ACRC2V_20575 [Xenococcaceae cyanobacterium]